MVCGRYYTQATNLSWHMTSHHHKATQPTVFQQPSVDEFLAVQPEKTLSLDATHTHYEYSTLIPDT